MGTGRRYDEEFKKQAVKLAKEIGNKDASEELDIPRGTLGTWVRRAREGEIDTGKGTRSPQESLILHSSFRRLTKESRNLKREIVNWKK